MIVTCVKYIVMDGHWEQKELLLSAALVAIALADFQKLTGMRMLI